MVRFAGWEAVTLAILVATVAAADHPNSFSFYDIDGGLWVGDELVGLPVVLFFTATWCAPCELAEDGLRELFPEYGSAATFLGVFLPPNNAVPDLQTHRQTRGTPWPVGPEQDGMQTRFAVESIPVVVVLRYNGEFGYRWDSHTGFSPTEVRSAVGDALDNFLDEVAALPPWWASWWIYVVMSVAASVLVPTALRSKASSES